MDNRLNRGTEYCGASERHEYELYLAVENIDHSRTKVKSSQTNGIVERFHRTVPNEFYRVGFQRQIYASIEELQRDLKPWVKEYNELRPHQGRWSHGFTTYCGKAQPDRAPHRSAVTR